MKTKIKLFLLVLPLILVAKEATVKQLFSVQTIKVKKETKSQRIKNYGYVMTDESRKYDISPRFGGYIVELHADKIYKKVKKGEALATVYSPEVFKAKDEYLNTFKYIKQRPNKGMLESAKLKLQLLGISNEEINEVIDGTKVSPNTTIYSPIDGYVFVKSVDKGAAFNAKQKLFQIVNLDEVWVETKLFEEERARLSTTSSYELTFKGLDKVYKTNNKLLYPQLDPKVATLTLRLRVDNQDHNLFPGMYANVISLKDEKSQLVLPTTAVIRKSGTHYVFMVGEYEGEYEPLEVTAKIIDANTYAIISGLNEGDEVVNNALFMMDSDAQINSLY
ncbi:efflux RND transporter periplasmic adaptor subunit [Candidatus Sulfurimonas marisnigri]|uniref:Efflux RND transporter periplasmic adaptor subunit n=1 Tax=Candidatus Sulfurimonas marisnigri TaxID=2740405 RepID=A0A7S7RQP6_9BACT|nr:efflux RND transporter periplasmic adaptor subunit [Candidatus Sulfurimonas marisnigri]QOY54778.1 efflux RND transporter periplasmic adaptor subunit [Candidatus Sulfurimonas marisnigri]